MTTKTRLIHIEIVALLDWLQRKKTSALEDEKEYLRRSDHQQADCCGYSAGAYQQVIDKISRSLKEG